MQTLSSVLSCVDVEEELLTVVVVQSTASNTGSRVDITPIMAPLAMARRVLENY